MKCKRTPMEAEVTKYEVGKNMEDGVEYTTTNIKEAVPGFEEVSILTLGGLMKDVVATALVNVEVKNGKKFYTKA